MLRLSIKHRLTSLSQSSESLVPSIIHLLTRLNAATLPCAAAILSAILKFVIGFVSNFYNSCALSLPTSQWKNEVSILKNGWVTVNYSVSQPPFFYHLEIGKRICVNLLQLMSGVITYNSVKKNEVSILINGCVTAKYSVSRPPFCPPSWNL